MNSITPAAKAALSSAKVVIGYKTYLDLVQPLIADKQVFSSGMRNEIERCQAAIDQAMAGKIAAIVSSGDAGVYGMAGLILEIAHHKGLVVEKVGSSRQLDFYIDVVPGIPALMAGAALLGAPLMQDFASISLSDLMTPWEKIEQRIKAAATADFVIGFYNPKSKKRNWQLSKALEIILHNRHPTIPVGIVHKAMREGQRVKIIKLGDYQSHLDEIDMQTIVIVGNSTTYQYGEFMVTPRGYLDKYEL